MDMNLQLRYGIQWDPTNAAKLLGYIKKMNYQDVFNFEMGNGKYMSGGKQRSKSYNYVNVLLYISQLWSKFTAQTLNVSE